MRLQVGDPLSGLPILPVGTDRLHGHHDSLIHLVAHNSPGKVLALILHQIPLEPHLDNLTTHSSVSIVSYALLISLSRIIVFNLAILFFTVRPSRWFASCLVARRNRRLNSSRWASSTCFASSSSLIARRSSATSPPPSPQPWSQQRACELPSEMRLWPRPLSHR